MKHQITLRLHAVNLPRGGDPFFVANPKVSDGFLAWLMENPSADAVAVMRRVLEDLDPSTTVDPA